MKVHYINILLFALPLNILEHNKNEPHTTPNHTQTTRSLCECELYSPTNYDNDPEMKRVMQQFEDRTTQRFHEYDEKMQSKRIQCKEQCEKDMQKIILKDKLEKELMDKFATLQTDIQNDAIPTCVCEKSLADKVEKNCMKCTQNLGGIVAPSSGVLAGIAELGLSAWKTTALKTAIAAAEQAGAAMGKAAGDAAGATEVIKLMKTTFYINELNGKLLESVFTTTPFNKASIITQAVYSEFLEKCMPRLPVTGVPTGPSPIAATDKSFCSTFEALGFVQGTPSQTSASTEAFIKKKVETMVLLAENTAGAHAEAVTEEATVTLTIEKTGVVQTTYMGYQISIIASIVAIVVIVLIMVIIYLVLRYRRKKKMKKKLQYIKLLEE
ncbi:rifin [Plasmodium falciparum IGH-CR14]|uniref:Rifin n=1 Tax=Plasmodium falciparum IGH-CR14 TaxID=580059 RepID=A0A0L1I363_PLAFA|nr:rifin [Plasmodium falciparum IGH-CR14]